MLLKVGRKCRSLDGEWLISWNTFLQEIGGREIKVNITEKPLVQVDLSLLQAEDSNFVDSPYKVYVGNLAKTVTSEMLKKFFSEKGQVLSAKVSRVPGTSKSSGFGFVTFSSEEDAEAAISSLNNSVSSLLPLLLQSRLFGSINFKLELIVYNVSNLICFLLFIVWYLFYLAAAGRATNSCKQGIVCDPWQHL